MKVTDNDYSSLITFQDEYGQQCSMELRFSDGILSLGNDRNRMVLTRELAAKLFPHLKAYADTGSIKLPWYDNADKRQDHQY